MGTPRCDECNKPLPNWSGNVMVDGTTYPDNIDFIMIWCKECTGSLDRKGAGRQYHNLWELSWVKQGYFDLEKDLFEELTVGRRRWSLDALKQFNRLGRLLYLDDN
ncbi:hypothetical protein WQ54_19360 [Bacillus sp. SA1-12]|uniref:hypothetical protein n=1 Tax=Bacillus sp. SA1-12 TaxID=1455638 RepID=UPI0006272DA0|nr:hypothetical protein [Bacillus sp. SA1-12]KKI90680.1 hypothetical protein WQ54_19360 [Bacillus sp. SA1-12]